jgi:hypothetical protein
MTLIAVVVGVIASAPGAAIFALACISPLLFVVIVATMQRHVRK